MAKDSSFDISAKVDMQEIKNIIEQAKKEVTARYDFKGILKDIDLNETGKYITLVSSTDNKIDAMFDILISRTIKRGISPKALKFGTTEDCSGGNKKVNISIVDTISKDDAKKIIKEIKVSKLKVQATIQGEEIRVTGKSKNDLQSVMALVKKQDLEVPLTFDNFR